MSLKAEKNGGIFSRPWFIVLAACFCCALWGSATPFIKMGYKIIYADFENAKPDIQSTILFAGIRFALAGFITIALYSIARRKVLYPKFENLGKIGSVALVQTVIQYFLQIPRVQRELSSRDLHPSSQFSPRHLYSGRRS